VPSTANINARRLMEAMIGLDIVLSGLHFLCYFVEQSSNASRLIVDPNSIRTSVN